MGSMAKAHSRWVNGNLVFYDTYQMRWLDAYGAGVSKYLQDFASIPVDDTTGFPTEWTATAVEVGAGTSIAALGTTVGGNLRITTAGNEDDGLALQLKGEAFQFDSAKPLYFGCKMTISEATQTDLFLGLSITDTTPLGGVTDGHYFECLDGVTTISFVTEKDSTETTTTVGTMTTAARIYEMYWDGTTMFAWVDGTATALTQTNICDDEVLTPTIHYLNGSAAARTADIDWLRVIQLR